MRRLDWFVAWRYLTQRRGSSMLSLLTSIAVGGVAVGTAALIVVMGVMTGMKDELRDKILGSTPHMFVLEWGSALRMNHWETVADSVLSVDGVVGVAPFIVTQVVVRTGGQSVSGDLFGVSLDRIGEPVTDMERDIQGGVLSLTETLSGLPPVVLGSTLAERLSVAAGDTVVLMALETLSSGGFGLSGPNLRRYEVTGVFTTGMHDYDLRNLYAPLGPVQELLRLTESGQVSGLSVRTADAWLADDVAVRVRDKVGFGYRVDTWSETNRSLFSSLELQKWAMSLVLFLVIVVAAFGVVSLLTMVVEDRTREIGILKSIGMTDRQILRIFMLQGLCIGLVGTGLGTGIGGALAWLQDRFQIVRISSEVYLVDRLPVTPGAPDVLLIIVAATVIAVAASVIPARKAARLAPVEAIRAE